MRALALSIANVFLRPGDKGKTGESQIRSHAITDKGAVEMSGKSVEYLTEHPEEATTADLIRMANEDSGAEAEANTEQVVDTSASTGAVVAKVVPQEEVVGDIVSRDGKHTIPYDVLKAARETAQSEAALRQAAEARAAEIQARFDELQARAAAAPTQAAATQAAEQTQASPLVSAEELAQINEDFPTLGKVMAAQMAEIERLRTQVVSVASVEAARAVTAEQTAATQVQDIIDANVKLSTLQADPVKWAQVVKIDQFLKSQPETQSLSLGERFEKAVQSFEVMHGAVQVPTTKQAAPASPSAQVQAMLGSKAAGQVPSSLSALPGGLPVESEQATLESATVAEIGERFSKMNAEQREAYLNSLG